MLKAFPDQNKARSLESHRVVLSFSRKREFASVNSGLAKPGWAAALG
jgi:hypothetical protein